jgi:Flp pilus assembly protein protease CpaA
MSLNTVNPDRKNRILLWIVGVVLFVAYTLARAANLDHDAYGLRWLYKIIFFALAFAIFYGWTRRGK